MRKLGLVPHPEGGFYREIHRSQDQVETPRGCRSSLTTIYFLLLKDQRSLFHRVLADEVWHYYEGAPLRLLRLSPEVSESETLTLGPKTGKQAPVAVIPSGHWQAAESLGEYTLVGCTVGPGFDFADFTMLRDLGAEGEAFKRKFPRLLRFLT